MNVKMGDYEIGQDNQVLTAMGLGSCVGVCLYDQDNQRAGLAHVMLPAEDGEESSKHADVLLDSVFTEMKNKGSHLSDLEVKIYGGASMFDNSFDIGERNISSVKEEISSRGLNIAKEDTGGTKGRAIWLNCKNGNVVVRKSFTGNRKD